MKQPKIFFYIILTICIFSSHVSQANLLITPFRAVLDDKNRTTEITLLNSTDSTKTYNIEWEEKQQTETGGYINLTDITTYSASPHISFSPRHVTIKPGEYQKIKLRLKNNGKLDIGEYRSHLKLKSIGDSNDTTATQSNQKGLTLQLIPRLSFSIPIMIRKGTLDTSSSINSIVALKTDDNKPYVDTLIQHSGVHSSYGTLIAYMKVGNGKTEKIGELGNVSLYRESKQRRAAINLQIPEIPKGAIIQVLYKGKDEFDGQILSKAAIRY